MRKVFLLTSFAVVTPIVVIINILLILYFSSLKNQNFPLISANTPKTTAVYAALPTMQNTSSVEITQADAREELVRQFFAKYGSPLEPYANDVIYYADLYKLDFRIVPSIAMQESNLCLRAPAESYNCWGFGIYGSKVKKFDNYSQGIEQVTKTLATVYKKSGLDTPEEIMTRYTPSSNGSWANGVNYFMDQLQ